jgi:hypothetical protein
MRVLRNCLGLAACALVLCPTGASARQLAVATVTPQGVACIFTPTCAVTATDTAGYFSLFGNAGRGSLLVRTYPGLPGTRAAGTTGYSLFVNMRGDTSLGTTNCVEKLTIDAGPIESVNYVGPAAEVFVVGSSGGAGLARVDQAGSKVTFTFSKPICPSPSRLTESLYFGFAAKGAPVPGKVQITGTQGSADVMVRIPKH